MVRHDADDTGCRPRGRMTHSRPLARHGEVAGAVDSRVLLHPHATPRQAVSTVMRVAAGVRGRRQQGRDDEGGELHAAHDAVSSSSVPLNALMSIPLLPTSTMPGTLCGSGPLPSPVNCHPHQVGHICVG